jgi:hypothetical protein
LASMAALASTRCVFFAARDAFALTSTGVGDTLVPAFWSPAGRLHVPAETAKFSPKYSCVKRKHHTNRPYKN